MQNRSSPTHRPGGFMKSLSVYLFALFACVFLMSTVAQAQASRTWVSGVGDDANPCSRTAPCKTFAGAISKTASGGEIDVLDPGGFGAVTITKPITIDGGGGIVASILVSGTNGIIVNSPSGTVILRNLSINGIGQSVTPGINAIRYLSGGQLIVENCNIMGFSNNGIDVALGASGDLVVRNTSFSTIAQTAINLTSTAGTLSASLSNVSIRGVTNGVNTGFAGAAVDISNSTITQTSGIGLHATLGSIVAENNMLTSNATAVLAETGATIRLSNNSIFNNVVGIGCNVGTPGTIASAGNNKKGNNPGAACAPNATVTLQ